MLFIASLFCNVCLHFSDDWLDESKLLVVNCQFRCLLSVSLINYEIKHLYNDVLEMFIATKKTKIHTPKLIRHESCD